MEEATGLMKQIETEEGGVRVTPENLVPIARMVADDRVEIYQDGWGYLWARPFKSD
jgi:serine kinase of HPr protein (carbohydrate metabolism regulator)